VNAAVEPPAQGLGNVVTRVDSTCEAQHAVRHRVEPREHGHVRGQRQGERQHLVEDDESFASASMRGETSGALP
jgi:hypothetical protein